MKTIVASATALLAVCAVAAVALVAPASAAVPTRPEPLGWSDDGMPFMPVPSFPDPSFPDPFPDSTPTPTPTPAKGPKWINLWKLSGGVGGPAMVVNTPYILWGCLAKSSPTYALYPLADGSAFTRPVSKGTIVGKSTDCTRQAPYLIRFEPLSVPVSKVASNGTYSVRFGTYNPNGGNPTFSGGYTVPVFTSAADCARNGYDC